MKVLVLGYFGFETNQIDGQTIKTRDIYSLLQKNIPGEVDYFDTQSFKRSKLKLLTLLVKLVKADIVFYLPAHANLTYIFPFIYAVTKLTRIRLNYLVVGGWLYDFLKNKPLHRYMLKKIDGIYTETENLKYNLESIGFSNVQKLHNFRSAIYPVLEKRLVNKENIKLVFMARVHPLKGVDLLFELEHKLKNLNIKNIVIDIYGPIHSSYENDFFDKLDTSSINYNGVIDPVNVYSVLKNYDLMLFPTKYYTEGFPGTILDSYISGVPVIVTKWLNAAEFVENGKTGIVCDFNNSQDFIDNVVSLVLEPEKIDYLNKHVTIKRDDFSKFKAWDILKKALYKNS